MQDLSSQAKNGPWITSQDGGNMIHDNSPAMTGPGSPPVTPIPARQEQGDPTVTFTGDVPVGSKPDRSGTGGGYTPSAASWKDTQ